MVEPERHGTNIGDSAQLPPSYVDTRQPTNLVTPFRRAGWIVKALKYGDYEMVEAGGGRVLIEDKPIGKLISDMESGVLQRQIIGLVESCEFPILLIRGHWARMSGDRLLNSRVTWCEAWNQLQSLQDVGCRLQLATSTPHAIERVFELESYYRKGVHHSVGRHISGDPRLAVLSLIPGIDEVKGKSLLDPVHGCGNSLLAVAQSTIPDLENCHGIGEVLAERIWGFWR